MAPRRESQAQQQQAAADSTQLPTTNGTVLHRASWLRELSNNSHLFDSDIAYLLHTGCGITSSFTAVISPEHSALLQQGYISQQDFNVFNPPPIKDGFKALHAQVVAELVAAEAAATAGTPEQAAAAAAVAALPSTAPSTLCLLYTSPSPRD